MSLFSPLLFLLSFVFFSCLNAKFYFNFHSNSLKLPSCSLSGVKTVHLPYDPSRTAHLQQTLNIRLHFLSPSTPHPAPINFEVFSSSAQRLYRLELDFLHDHVQINWNGLLSSWHGIQLHHNYLDIKLSPEPIFKLNGKTVSVKVSEPVNRPVAFKLIYDELVVPDSDWYDLVNDPEILNSLQNTPPTWQAPLISYEIPEETPDKESRASLVDYIVYDCESFSQLQISSGIALPKVIVNKKKKSNNKTKTLFNYFKLKFWLSPVPLPVVYGATKNQAKNTRILGTLVISAFIVYLAVLLHLSKMTSIRPGSGKKLPIVPLKQQPSLHQQSLSQSHSDSHSHSQSKSLSQSQLKLPTTVNPFKSSSRTILIDLPDAPLFKSSLSTSGSILKVSVPAAFSLADNRHILFPSKLRK